MKNVTMEITYEIQFERFKNIINTALPTAKEHDQVTNLLGRNPDGMKRVIYKNGEMTSILSDTIVRQRPFPTLFWLINKNKAKIISSLEATGLVKELESDKSLIPLLQEDNLNYSKLRRYYHETLHAPLNQEHQYYKSIYETGAGGLGDHSRIRCLHLHLAYHYSVGSNLGAYLCSRFKELNFS